MTEIPRIEPAADPAVGRDAETARLLGLGDPDGVRRLLVDHAGKVIAVLRKEFAGVLDYQEIDDAVSQASARAWRSGGRFDPARGSLGAWFFTIARNCARRLLETKARHATLALVDDLDSTAAAVASKAESLDPTVPAVEGSFLADVRRCVEALPPQQRAVLQADLAAGGAASNDDLAAQLATTKNSIYVSRNNGRRNLREALRRLGHTFDEGDGKGGAAAPGGWG